jgi:predicted DNA-binding transcriptional regulator YafY
MDTGIEGLDKLIGNLARETKAKVVIIDYTNHRGFRAERKILPSGISFDSSEWHEGPQWLLDAYDLEKMESRTFAMRDIHSWRPFRG